MGIGNDISFSFLSPIPHSRFPTPHSRFPLRFPDSDNAAGLASPGIASRLGFQVIGAGVNYHAVTNYRAVPVHFRHRIIEFEMGHPILIGLDVAHVAGVTLGGLGRSVGRVGRIEMAAC